MPVKAVHVMSILRRTRTRALCTPQFRVAVTRRLLLSTTRPLLDHQDYLTRLQTPSAATVPSPQSAPSPLPVPSSVSVPSPLSIPSPVSVPLPLSIEIALDRKSLILTAGEPNAAKQLRFHAVWLRHNCQCDACKQPFSGQKLIDPALLQPSYTLDSARKLTERNVCVTWQEEDHASIFPLKFLLDNEYSTSTIAARRAAGRPTPCTKDVPVISRTDLNTDEGVLQWLRLINEFGVCVVRGVPTRDGEVRRLAELMGPIQRTIYGDVWDVKSSPEPINVAYSDAQLDFHMDLAYYESPPGIQFLHCIRFDNCVEGGDSLFVDAWHVAETMRDLHPDQFTTLTRVPATFQKIHFTRDSPVHMRYQRPHIVLEPGGRITAVNWAPAFEGPLQVPEYEVDAYYRAYRTYAQLLHASASKLRFRMAPGDLVSFNNRRILHARDAFRLNGGMRHLQGCYVNIDEFRSGLEVMAKRTNADVTVKHVFNQCWF